MTVLRIAILAGAMVGLGLAVIVGRLMPAAPDLTAAMGRLNPDRATRAVPTGVDAGVDGGAAERFGIWIQRRAPGLVWRVPARELAMLRIPVPQFIGQKALYAVAGLVFPFLASVLLLVMGTAVAFPVPVIAGLALGVGLSFLPDYNVRDDAAAARVDFLRALSCYIDLVALERQAGTGTTQSLEVAAGVGDSWVFARIREELARARWAGQPPWEGLADLAEELRLPELNDLADIMRLSGEEGAAVYTTLRARSASMKAALLSEEHSKANATDERMTFPVTLLAFIFLLLVATPAILQIVLGGGTT